MHHQDSSLCSFPSLPVKAALQTHNPYSLQIPLDRVCSHHPSSCSHALTGFFRQTKHFSQAAKNSSTHHICSSASFLAVMGRFPDSACTAVLTHFSLTPTLPLLPCLAPPVLKSCSAFCPTLLAAAAWAPLQ